MYPKNNLLAIALCISIYALNTMLIINDEQLLMVGDESTKIYVAIIHIIIPILIIRYLLKKNKDDIISIEVVLIFATFLGRIIYNNIIVAMIINQDFITLIMALAKGPYLNAVIIPALKSASLTIIIYLLINIIMEKKINSSEIILTKKVIKLGFMYMVFYVLYTAGVDIILSKILYVRFYMYDYMPEIIFEEINSKQKGETICIQKKEYLYFYYVLLFM